MPQSLSDLDVIKRAHLKTDWTETTLQELLQCGEDPLYFMESFMRIQHPTRGAIPFNAYIYQKRMVAAMQAHRFSILMTGRQLGKALALTTPIPSPSGWTTMGDLQVGDQVYGSDGLPTTITFATDTMLGHECFEVEFDNGEIIIADAEHLWRVEFGSSARIPPVDTITTRDLIPCLEKSKKRGQGIRIKLSVPLNTPEADLPVPPYTLGVWLGDGNSADGRFCGHKDDCLEMRDHVAADGFHLSEIKSDPRNNVQFQTIYGLRGRLVEAGVFKNKHIPRVYLRASIAQRLELLRGLMDTDGYADRNGGMEFYQKDFQFTLEVFELIASLGMKPRWASKLINGVPYHRVRFATTKHEVFKLARKQQIAEMTQGHQKNDHYYIRDIRPSPSVPVRCIQVDNQSHMYLCGRSMIPTHNTTCAAGYLTWKAMFVPDSTILVVANKFTQALEVMERVRYCYENLPNHIRAGVTEYNKSNISFDNGSRIIARATSADAGRGLAVSLLYCDEFAFVPPNKQKEFWTSIQPTLAEGGSCIITSTPKNDEDIFAQIWKGAEDNRDEYGNEIDGGVGKNGFYAVKVPWYEHPDRDEEWARPWRESLGEARFRQEFELDWVSDDETLINPLTLSRMIPSPPTSYTGTVRWYHDPQPNHGFLVALDPAMGTERNYGAIEVFQMPEMIQVAEWQHNGLAARHQVRMLMEILCEIEASLNDHPEQHSDPEIYWTFENNSLGEGVLTVIEDSGEDRFPGMLVTERRRKGLQMRRVRRGLFTTNRNKLSACARLKSLIESDRMVIFSNNLLRQLKTFVSSGASFGAKPGENDDLVSATLMVVRMLDVALAWGTEAGDLREHIADDEIGGEPMPVVI